MDKASRDNRSNQLNPNNPAYGSSRGSDVKQGNGGKKSSGKTKR